MSVAKEFALTIGAGLVIALTAEAIVYSIAEHDERNVDALIQRIRGECIASGMIPTDYVNEDGDRVGIKCQRAPRRADP